MTHIVCDNCASAIDRETGLRVFSYGKQGITVMPFKGVSKMTLEDKHFCSGECLIDYYEWIPERGEKL